MDDWIEGHQSTFCATASVLSSAALSISGIGGNFGALSQPVSLMLFALVACFLFAMLRLVIIPTRYRRASSSGRFASAGITTVALIALAGLDLVEKSPGHSTGGMLIGVAISALIFGGTEIVARLWVTRKPRG